MATAGERVQDFPAPFLFEMKFCSVSQGVELSGTILAPFNLYLLGSSDSLELSLPSRWDYSCVPPRLANFGILVETSFNILVRLVLNS